MKLGFWNVKGASELGAAFAGEADLDVLILAEEASAATEELGALDCAWRRLGLQDARLAVYVRGPYDGRLTAETPHTVIFQLERPGMSRVQILK